jgi:hypothetical protein
VIEAARWGQNLRLDITTPVYISMDIDGPLRSANGQARAVYWMT